MGIAIKIDVDTRNFDKAYRKMVDDNILLDKQVRSVGAGIEKGIILPLQHVENASSSMENQLRTDFSYVQDSIQITEVQLEGMSKALGQAFELTNTREAEQKITSFGTLLKDVGIQNEQAMHPSKFALPEFDDAMLAIIDDMKNANKLVGALGGKRNPVIGLVGAVKDLADGTQSINEKGINLGDVADLAYAAATIGGIATATQGLGISFGTLATAAGPLALVASVPLILAVAVEESVDRLDSRVNRWAQQFPEDTATILERFADLGTTAVTNLELLEKGVGGSEKAVTESFNAMGDIAENSLKSKIAALQEQAATAPSFLEGVIKEQNVQELEGLGESLQNIESYNAERKHIQENAARNGVELTALELEQITDLSSKATEESLKHLVEDQNQRERILKSMTGDVEASTKTQAEAVVESLEKQRLSAETEYEAWKKSQKEALDPEEAKKLFAETDRVFENHINGIDDKILEYEKVHPGIISNLSAYTGEFSKALCHQGETIRDRLSKAGREAKGASDEVAAFHTSWQNQDYKVHNAHVLTNANETKSDVATCHEDWQDQKYEDHHANILTNANETKSDVATCHEDWQAQDYKVHNADILTNVDKTRDKQSRFNNFWGTYEYLPKSANIKTNTDDVKKDIRNTNDWVSKFSFTSRVISIGVNLLGKLNVSKNAKGTDYFIGGLTRIHEKGDEVINLPTGTQILTAGLSNQLMREYGRAKAQFDQRQLHDIRVVTPSQASSINLHRVESLLSAIYKKDNSTYLDGEAIHKNLDRRNMIATIQAERAL